MNEDASTKKIWLRVNFLNFTEGEYYKSEKKISSCILPFILSETNKRTLK